MRMFEAVGAGDWFNNIPESFKPEQGMWRIVLLQHIFGSEELSLRSPPLAERAPAPCAMLNPSDAETLAVASGDLVDIKSLNGNTMVSLPVKIEPSLPAGLLGITAGLPETRQINKLDRVTLMKTGNAGEQS